MYDQYHQSSVSDQYDMRHHDDRMYAERAGLQQHHSSPNMSQAPSQPQQSPGAGHHRTSSGPPSQYGAPPGAAQYNGNGHVPPTSQYNGAYQQPQVQQIPIQRESNYAPAPPQPPPAPPIAPAAPPAPPAPPMAPAAPAAPPPPPTGGAPPPPPPPVPISKSDSAEPVSGLAAALQAAKLKKTSNGVKTGATENGTSNGSSR